MVTTRVDDLGWVTSLVTISSCVEIDTVTTPTSWAFVRSKSDGIMTMEALCKLWRRG